MFVSIFQGIIDTFSIVLAMIVTVFPTSPFRAVEGLVIGNDMLAILAWLVPFPQIIALLQAWGAAIMVFYVWMVIGRWVKVLGD